MKCEEVHFYSRVKENCVVLGGLFLQRGKADMRDSAVSDELLLLLQLMMMMMMMIMKA